MVDSPDNDADRTANSHTVFVWLGAFAVALLAFYLLDHLIMSLQGLPLNFDMSPAG